MKKRKLTNKDQRAVAIAQSESTSNGTFVKEKKNRLNCDSYLNIGFTCCGDEVQPVPVCLICHLKLSNEIMVPSKLSRHFLKKHGHLSDKPASYFKRLLDERKQQSQIFTKSFPVSTKCQQASYYVAEIIAKNSKPHTEAEKVIFPACSAIVKTMFGTEAGKKIKQIFLSNDTICRRICDM